MVHDVTVDNMLKNLTADWWTFKSRNNCTGKWKRTYTHIKSHCFSFKKKSTKLGVGNRFKWGKTRFCVDFLYLNSNTQAFLYTIPNVDELTGSFTRHFQISYLPLTTDQVFFKCLFRQSKPSTSILPSILDFSTCMFNGLPMGLKTSSNSFQLLKNKVLNGLSFRSTLCYFDDVWGGSENF
jgi:hypothetical protein